MKKTVLKVCLILVAWLAVFPLIVRAEEDVWQVPELQIKLPGLVFSDQNKLETSIQDGGIVYNVPWLAEYLTWLYNYLIGIITVLALLAIMIGGFNWLLAGGNTSRVSEAKNWINAAFSGLGLALASFVLLNTINNELVKLPGIKIFSTKKIEVTVPALEGGSESNQVYQGASDCIDPCVSDSALKYAGDIKGVTCTVSKESCRVTSETYQKLTKAASLARQSGYKLQITSALRTCADQEALWNQYGKNPARVARPSCNNAHLRGTAVDIRLTTDKNVWSKVNYGLYPSGGPYNQNDTIEVKKLKEIMIKSGFTRYCREWWHFQSDTPKMPCYDPVR